MKIGFTLIFLLLITSCGFAQTEVSWSFSFDAQNNQVVAQADIGEGWHLYSTERATEMGPIPTEFEFAETEGVELVGAIQEPDPIVAMDANFGETLYYFEKEVKFVQDLKVTSAEKLNGIVTYMVCNEEMCMPPVDVKFTIELVHEN